MFPVERRKNRRVPLHWSASLTIVGSSERIQTTTEDISTCGFYCLLDKALVIGERLDCIIAMPAHTPHSDDVVYLRCVARVVRTEKADAGAKFGVACQIEDYHVTAPDQKFEVAGAS